MRSIDDIRRSNLVILEGEHGSLAALAKALERDDSQVSQWKVGSKNSGTGKPRGMRSETARYIESRTGKMEGWLDHYHPSLQDRFNEVFPKPQAIGLYQDIADLCGVSGQTVSGWFGSPENVQKISIDHAGRICGRYKLNVSTAWLAEGDSAGPRLTTLAALNFFPEQKSNVDPAPALVASRLVPVRGEVKGGPGGHLDDMQHPTGHGEGHIEAWTRDNDAYALRVRGDSMAPRYRAGEFIVVTPNIEPMPGMDVVVCLKDGQKMLKNLAWVRGDMIGLLSINDNQPLITIALQEIEGRIQRVAGSAPPDAFIDK